MTDWRFHFREWSLPVVQGNAVPDIVERGGDHTGTTIVDEGAFRSFYERTAPALLSYLRLRCGDSALADDLLQDSFVRFLAANVPDLNEFEMKAYLYRAAMSALTDHHRARQRERRKAEELVPRPELAGNPHLSPDMQRIFEQLDARQQSLLWLAYVEGFQHSEIAELLGIGEKSVRVVLYRARKQLAGLLTREGLGREKEL